MRRLENHLIGIDQGQVALFSDFEDNGPMWTESGPRAARTEIRFSAKFKTIPVVHVSMSMWDMDQTTNARADVSAEDISRDGFTIVFKTWGDTKVARARAAWIAFGEVPHDDDWDLA